MATMIIDAGVLVVTRPEQLRDILSAELTAAPAQLTVPTVPIGDDMDPLTVLEAYSMAPTMHDYVASDDLNGRLVADMIANAHDPLMLDG